MSVLTFGLGMAAVLPSADASGSQNYCPADRLCLWFNSGNSGARADFQVSDASLSNELFNDGPPGANGWLVQVGNNAASFHNRSGSNVVLYDLPDCNGTDGWFRGLALGEKGDLGTALKNKVSSIMISQEGACVNVDQSNA